MIIDYSNRYEMEIVHDILYKARGKGYVTETEIFDMAYPMIMGFERKKDDPYYYSELNFLQSYLIFDSLKRLVLLEKMQVKVDKASRENRILFCMYTAHKVKSGEYAIENNGVSFDFYRQRHYPFRTHHCEDLLQQLYGMTDGIIKSRFDLCYSRIRCANLCDLEFSRLLNIANNGNN